MNIFLDTSILYSDPFLKGSYSSQLLDFSKDKQIQIYISRIVLKEIERNYSKILTEENNKIKDLNDKMIQYNIHGTSLTKINIDESVNLLKEFYENLNKQKIVIILEYTNDMFPEIIERAVYRKKPFKENKTELKDAIIWLSYSNYAEVNHLENCFLLTKNKSDFCDPDEIEKDLFRIHQDLESDSNKFKVYTSVNEILKKINLQIKHESELELKWHEYFTEKNIFDLIEKDYFREVIFSINKKLESYDLNKIFNYGHIIEGYCFVSDTELMVLREFEVQAFKTKCIVSGMLEVFCTIEGNQYNPVHDSWEEKYSYIGDEEMYIEVQFSFESDENLKTNNFYIEAIYISHE